MLEGLVWNAILTIAVGVGAYLWKTLVADVKELDKEIVNVKVNYVSKSELNGFKDDINKSFDKMDIKLDHIDSRFNRLEELLRNKS